MFPTHIYLCFSPDCVLIGTYLREKHRAAENFWTTRKTTHFIIKRKRKFRMVSVRSQDFQFCCG